MNKTLTIIILLSFLTYQKAAFAYLDPGTGSVIIQSIIASVAAGMYFLSSYLMNIKEFFIRIFSKKK